MHFCASAEEIHSSALANFRDPRAGTPGCTTQACGVRDNQAAYEKAGARVAGISPDPVKAIAKFAGKHSLGFTLLADPDHAVCDAYGTWAEKSMYGKKCWAPRGRRSSSTPTARSPRSSKRCSRKHDELVLAALSELHA